MTGEIKEQKPKIEYDKETKDIQSRIIWVWSFFILTVIGGAYAIKQPAVMPLVLCFIGFLIFNGIMLLYKTIVASTKKILEKKDGIF